MAVILLILKIIGIVLLVLLGILLYLILFPVWIEADGGSRQEPYLHAQVHGFLHFWQVSFDVVKESRQLAVKTLWGVVKIFPFPEKKKPDAEEKPSETPESPVSDTAADSGNGKPADQASPAATDSSPGLAGTAYSVSQEPAQTASEAPSPAKRRLGALRQKQKSEEEVSAAKEEPAEGAESESSSGQKDMAAMGKKLLDAVADPANRRAVGKIFKWLLYIPKKMRFHMGGTDLTFALSDAMFTGYVSAILTQLPVYYEPDVRLVPDFTAEDPYMDGYVRLNAHLSIAMILYAGIRILLYKDCRHLIKTAKGLMAS